MVTYLKKDFESSKVNSTKQKKVKNELLTDAKVRLLKVNLPVQESENKAEFSPTVNFNEFWVEFSALVSELDALVTEIKALDDD
tara:strand:- start:510 stop:761 length:252 start_codon:yes stop_codon:yes gene_type:complete